jgi:hypothetical protein
MHSVVDSLPQIINTRTGEPINFLFNNSNVGLNSDLQIMKLLLYHEQMVVCYSLLNFLERFQKLRA